MGERCAKRMPYAMAVLLSAVVALTAGPVGAAEKIRVAGNFPTDHTSSVAMELFKAEVEKLTGGALTVDLFPAMQLGGAQENVDQVRSGTILMTWVGVAYLSRLVPALEAVSLPFLFPGREAAFRVMDGQVGELIDGNLARKGFLSLGYMELGARHVTNNVRPLRTLEDFKGLKIRLQPNETHLATFRALGANPVAMDIKEVYSALQQGVLDGQENPYTIIKTRNFNEVQKYLSDTNHFFDFIIVIANKQRLEALKPEFQRAIRSAMDKAIASQRQAAARADTAALEDLKRRGMQFDPLPAEARAALRRASASVVDVVRKRAGADMVDGVLAQVR